MDLLRASVCGACGSRKELPPTQSGEARIPKGWKRLHGDLYCRDCARTSFVLRAVTMPVVGPVDGTWDEFGRALTETWAEATRCANWMVSQYYARDVRRAPGDVRLAPMPPVSLYAEARLLFPLLPSQAVSSLAQQILSTYRAQRFELLWLGTRSLASYRFPVPCPFPATRWTLEHAAGGWQVRLRLGERRWTLRLRGGPHMRAQIERLQLLASGDAEAGTASLFPAPANAGDRRGGTSSSRVMLKMVGWFPKARPEARDGVLRVRTGHGALIGVEGSGWRIDAEPMRRVLAADDRRRRALLTNLRALPAGGRRGPRAALEALSRKSRARLADACRTYAAAVARQAVRQRVACVEYDDRDQGALPHFPWAYLKTMIEAKLDEARIAFVHHGATTSGRSVVHEDRPVPVGVVATAVGARAYSAVP